MTTLNFTKMHGLGNDFMVVDATETPFVLDAETIGALGNRKTGVGFDQLLVVEPPSQTDVDFNYRIFNTDGSEVEHCGNGARCFAKFVIDNGLTDKKQFRVKVKKGIIRIDYHNDDYIEVDMDKPILTPADVPFAIDSVAYQKDYSLTIDGEALTASVLSMGNPHVVIFTDNLWQRDIATLGQAIQQSAYFPQSVNVNFVEIIDENTIHLRTYERGVGETDACGTGACASAFAAIELGGVQSPVTVVVRGGQLTIRVEDGRIFMSGPARTVYQARVKLPFVEKVEKANPQHRPIKSFVRHHGRLTAGQQQALDNYWGEFGIDYRDEPLDLSTFGDFDTMVFEIGFGNGESFIQMAESAPNTLFIGAEVHKPGVGRALMLAHEKGLKNVRVLEHDAVEFIDKMLADNSLDRVQVYFPDPWHKKRHHKRRLIQPLFCEKLQRVLKPKGILHVATDWVPYAEHCIEVIDSVDTFDNQSNADFAKPDYRPETKFERRGLKLGHEVRDLLFVSTK